ncbi:MAG: lipoyl(octanoyl) transferase LipB [Spirochaetales bacterium]|nr:lipoyl(octanoyl) transferase LipB [Spirochaetales bacterium]
MNVNIVDLGKMEYGKALEIQEKTVPRVLAREIDNTLFMVEHPPVITLGRRAKREHILLSDEELAKEGVELFDISRGGDVTYHGPGQLVAYPILRLDEFGKDLHLYVTMLEETIINLLKKVYDLEPATETGKYTGVYMDSRKITAIGIAVRKWVSYHGIAFNVKTNLKHFDWIIPCGLADRTVTSLEREIGRAVDFETVKSQFIQFFAERFEIMPVFKTLEEIL